MIKSTVSHLKKIKNIAQVVVTGDQWDDYVNNLVRELLLYHQDLSENRKQHIFKQNIKLIEFEPLAFCNRRCSFCPDSFLDRKHNKTILDFEIFKKVIRDLVLINYDQSIRFARYSEPLAFHDIFKYIAFARHALPKVEIDIVSNGDYIKDTLLTKLKEAGLSTLRISIYPDKDSSAWDHAKAISKAEQLGKRIKLRPKLKNETENIIQWRFDYEGLDIYAEARNLYVTGFDRGQSMDFLTDREYERTTPCGFVFSHITIDYNGAVMPCCNLLSDIEAHKPFIIETLTPQMSIYDVYMNQKFTSWRRGLVTVGKKQSPCDTCKQKALDNKIRLKLLNHKIISKLNEIGVTQHDLTR